MEVPRPPKGGRAVREKGRVLGVGGQLSRRWFGSARLVGFKGPQELSLVFFFGGGRGGAWSILGFTTKQQAQTMVIQSEPVNQGLTELLHVKPKVDEVRTGACDLWFWLMSSQRILLGPGLWFQVESVCEKPLRLETGDLEHGRMRGRGPVRHMRILLVGACGPGVFLRPVWLLTGNPNRGVPIPTSDLLTTLQHATLAHPLRIPTAPRKNKSGRACG